MSKVATKQCIDEAQQFEAWLKRYFELREPEPVCPFEPCICDRAYSSACADCLPALECWLNQGVD